jgi:exonuclease III
MAPQLTILQWNAKSMSAHKAELVVFLSEIKLTPDVICVQETLLQPQTTSANYNIEQGCQTVFEGGP